MHEEPVWSQHPRLAFDGLECSEGVCCSEDLVTEKAFEMLLLL